MMRSYVCQQCRLQLSRRLASPRYPQWQSRASIVSFRKSQPQPQTETEKQPTLEKTRDSNESIAVQEKHGPGNREQHGPVQAHQPRYSGDTVRRASEGRNTGETGRDQGAFEIRYEDARYNSGRRYGRFVQPAEKHDQSQQEHFHEDSSVASPSTSTTSPSPAQTITRHLKQGRTTDAWGLFKQTYTSRHVPALTDPSVDDIPLLTDAKVFARLLHAIISDFVSKERYLQKSPLPTPTQVMFEYAQLDIAPPRLWSEGIGKMTYHVISSMSDSEKKGRVSELIMAELLSLWKVFFQWYGTQQPPDSLEAISSEWKSIPDDLGTGDWTERHFGSRLQQFHPSFVSDPQLQFSAIVIFNYFYGEIQTAPTVSDSLRQANEPFLRLLRTTLAGANVKSAMNYLEASRNYSNIPETFRRSLYTGIDYAPVLAMEKVGHGEAASAEERAARLEDFFLARIARQVLSQANATALEKLWTEAEVTYRLPDERVQIPPDVYNAFLSGFMALHQPDDTVKVWNHMIQHGVKPELKTWNSLLDGCAKANDLRGVKDVWERMLRSGAEPDHYSWTTRVHALIQAHQVNPGLAALDEMGKAWRSAEDAMKSPPNKGKGARNLPSNARTVNKLPKPSVEVINGALAALVALPTKGGPEGRRNGFTFQAKAEYMHKILQWAGNFDIKPDARTYNALIKLHLSGNDYATTFKLLKQMENEGIVADLATHTMLLRAAFDNNKFGSLSHAEQADRILTLFNELEQGGLKLNQYVYQIAVDRFLKYYSNYHGVRAVIDHMMNRSLVPSPQIYTSLVMHYFQQSPPDIRAVDSLVARIFGPPMAPTDARLFDRLIEGYARNMEIASMMTVLTKMGKQRKPPSYRSLTAAVNALFHSGDWERARALVRDVETDTRLYPTGGINERKRFLNSVNAMSPELLEGLAGEHFKAPPRVGDDMLWENGEAARREQGVQGDGGASGPDEHAQSYEQNTSAGSPYDGEQYQQTPHQDEHGQVPGDEFVNAEHSGYLSHEPEVELGVPPQQSESPSDSAAANR